MTDKPTPVQTNPDKIKRDSGDKRDNGGSQQMPSPAVLPPTTTPAQIHGDKPLQPKK